MKIHSSILFTALFSIVLLAGDTATVRGLRASPDKTVPAPATA